MIDEVLILRKLAELEDYYQQIKEFETISVADYTSSWKAQRIV